jgi:hypothetical protein
MLDFPPSLPPIFRLLIEIPPASNDLLEDAMAGAALNAQPSRYHFPLVQARSWSNTILTDEMEFPTSAPFLAFEQEAGRCDVIRARHAHEGAIMDLAQTTDTFSVRLTPCRDSVDVVARKALRLPFVANFRRLGATKDVVFGDRDTTTTPAVSPGWPHWIDALHWWTSADSVGFISLKAAGGPTRAAISAEESLNRNWFSR